MPWDQVMHKWKQGQLHSGSDKGPVVNDRKQAIAIMLNEKKKANAGNIEYQAKTKMLGNSLKRKKKKSIKTAPSNLAKIFSAPTVE